MITSAMMMIESKPALRAIAIRPEAIAARDAAMEACALISVVRNAGENEAAAAAAARLHRFLAAVEADRVAAKEPALTEGRQIDTLVSYFVAEAKCEQIRVNKAIGDYLTLEEAKARDADLARRADLAELERAKHKALAHVSTHEEREEIIAKFEGLKAAVPVPSRPGRPPGQSARQKWEIEILDIDTLYRNYPHAVKLEPRLSEITLLLDRLDGELPGVKAQRVIAPGTTAGKRKQAMLEIGNEEAC